MADMSQSLRDTISRGESLADAALKKVFDFSASFAPETDHYSASSNQELVKESSEGKVEDKELGKEGSSSAKVPFKAEEYAEDGKRHLLLACSGSVATIKLPNIVKQLSSLSKLLSIRIIMTSSAMYFLRDQAEEQPSIESLKSVPGVDGIYRDEDEWNPPWTRGAPILHIELRRWADLLVVAPLSANTLAKMVNGICDNLLTSVIRAWDTEAMMGFAIKKTVESRPQSPSAGSKDSSPKSSKHNTKPSSETQIIRRRKQIMVAPAMNTAMWQHPITAMQLKVLQDDWKWVRVLVPTEKALACGDVGVGAMKEWSSIVDDIEEALRLRQLDMRQARTSVVAV